MNRIRPIAVTVLILLAAAAYAQRLTESVQVTIIEVPVTVLDKDGQPVRGLTAENFELYDEGKRMPIDYVEELDIASLSASPKGMPLPPAATRHFLLMFDLANSSPATIGRAGEAAKEFVQQQLGPRDTAAVATFTAEQGARMITNFTRDRSLLVNAIETLGHPKYFKVTDPLLISATRSADVTAADGGIREGVRSAIDAAFADIAEFQNRTAQSAQDSEMRNRLRIQLDNMGNVARVLSSIRGQKQIVLLSEGFSARLIHGREDLATAETQQETDAIMSGELWKVDNDKRFGNTSSSRDLSEMAELFRRSDVVLHAIDIKGLRGGDDAASAVPTGRTSSEGLHLITRPTGGSVFKNANDISENFDRMLKQQEVVYVLSYNAKTTGNPGRFHSLKVKPVNVRGARVSHRTGYYEPSRRLTDLERNLTLAEILMTDTPIEDVGITLGVTTLAGPGGRARVPVVVEIPGPRLLEDVSGNHVNAQLFLYAFNRDGQVVDFLQERISLDLAKAGDAIRQGGVRYYGSLRLPPGEHAIKALVRAEESGRIGFKRNDVDVPAFEKATVMPPVLFAAPGNWAMLVGPGRGDDYPYPFAVGDETYVPRSNPALTANATYTVALFLHRVPLENLSVTPTLIAEDGGSRAANVALVGRTSEDASGSVKLLFNFKLESIAAGAHRLQFDVKSRDGNGAVVSLPFRIQ